VQFHLTVNTFSRSVESKIKHKETTLFKCKCCLKFRYSIKKDKWIVVKIEYDRNEDKMELLSFSAGVQINENEILLFGGYDNSET
jgi:hypothetical protein